MRDRNHSFLKSDKISCQLSVTERRSISGRRPTLAHSERVFGGWSVWSWSIFELRQQTGILYNIKYIAFLHTNGDSHDSFFVFDRLFVKPFQLNGGTLDTQMQQNCGNSKLLVLAVS